MGSSEIQGKLWSAEAQDWAELFEPMSKPIWIAMLDSAGVGKGTRFVDLGCGGGGASVLGAERGAKVSGLDAAEALIKIAAERIPDGDFRVGDLEKSPFQDNSFEVTFSSLALMFAASHSSAVNEMARITKPGGCVTVGVWGNPEDCEYRHVLKAIADCLPTPPVGKGPFVLSATGVVEGLMDAEGIAVTDVGEVDAPFLFSDFDTMWRMVVSAGPVQAARQVVSETQLKEAVMQATAPFKADDGSYLLNNRFRYITGTA